MAYSLPKGYGSPYVKIYASTGEISDRVVNFAYKYSQDSDDTCQFRLETNDVLIADNPEYQEGVILSIQWGYINHPKFVSRKVVIVDVKANYTDSNISLDILCKDKASRLKGNSDKKIHRDTNLEKAAKEIAKVNNLDFNGVLMSSRNPVNDSYPAGTLAVGNVEQGYITKDGNYTGGRESTAKPMNFSWKAYSNFPQAGLSDYQLIRMLADNQPGGPIEVTGRDGELIIRKIPLDSKSVRTYKYKSGDELLEFNPETKASVKKAGAANVNTVGFNPETGDWYETNGNETNPYVKPLAEIVELPHPVFDPNKDRHLLRGTLEGAVIGGLAASPTGIGIIPGTILGGATGFLVSAVIAPPPSIDPDKVVGFNKTYQQEHIITQGLPENLEKHPTRKLLNEIKKSNQGQSKLLLTSQDGLVTYKEFKTADQSFINLNGNYTAAVDNTSIILPYGDIFPYSKSQPTIEDNPGDAHGKASNKQVQTALEKNPATATWVGHPELISGVIITVLGIAKKFTGNYYITECTHNIDPNTGWLITGTCKRGGTTKTGTEAPDKKPIPEVRNQVSNQPINKFVGPYQDDLTSRITQKNAAEGVPIIPEGFFPGMIKQDSSNPNK